MDTGSTPDLPAAVFETGHFGAVPHSSNIHPASLAHEIRRRARVLAKESDPHACWRQNFACARHSGSRVCPVLSTLEPAARCRHFEEQLQNLYRNSPNSFLARRHAAPADPEARRNRHVQIRAKYYSPELHHDVALARSSIPLPGERSQRRCPSLERQEAFYDQSTAKGKVRVRSAASDDAQVAELYRNGLLYNTDEDVKSTFDLNSIRHSEPTYIIRPAKRGRRHRSNGQQNGNTYSLERPLHLDLSFSDIGDDEAIARYFSASQQASPEDMIQHASSQDSGDSAPPPLRVIYELAGSQGSVDVDASQPPDLILDSEDFEFLSDSEMHDTPNSTQQSAADPSSAAWVMVGDDL